MEGALDTLTKTVLGAMVVLLSGVCGYLFKLLQAEKDKRLADAQQIAKDVIEASKDQSRVNELIFNKLNTAKRGGR